jgi:phytoene/squalene synthetase
MGPLVVRRFDQVRDGEGEGTLGQINDAWKEGPAGDAGAIRDHPATASVRGVAVV